MDEKEAEHQRELKQLSTEFNIWQQEKMREQEDLDHDYKQEMMKLQQELAERSQLEEEQA